MPFSPAAFSFKWNLFYIPVYFYSGLLIEIWELDHFTSDWSHETNSSGIAHYHPVIWKDERTLLSLQIVMKIPHFLGVIEPSLDLMSTLMGLAMWPCYYGSAWKIQGWKIFLFDLFIFIDLTNIILIVNVQTTCCLLTWLWIGAEFVVGFYSTVWMFFVWCFS